MLPSRRERRHSLPSNVSLRLDPYIPLLLLPRMSCPGSSQDAQPGLSTIALDPIFPHLLKGVTASVVPSLLSLIEMSPSIGSFDKHMNMLLYPSSQEEKNDLTSTYTSSSHSLFPFIAKIPSKSCLDFGSLHIPHSPVVPLSQASLRTTSLKPLFQEHLVISNSQRLCLTQPITSTGHS